ncbi:PAS domain-containing protein [Pseudomonas sp. NY15463]|uniref:PAS domain-containing protein n=1 Tax=Pseudomonas sp. NY15463 TaxID=3400361 RepID=UPI003A8381F3
MRTNLPVTQKELEFSAGQRLISATDLHGKLTYCNDEFVAVSGYSREQLLGSPHNIVRHPDMPSAVFAHMWSYLKEGKSWMGVVKNRCCNGDHYWVNAYVTPIFSQGVLTGYESVRVKPDRDQVQRAVQLYARLKDNKQSQPLRERLGFWVRMVLPPTLVAATSCRGLRMGRYATRRPHGCRGDVRAARTGRSVGAQDPEHDPQRLGWQFRQ